MFIGRKDELNLINNLLNRENGTIMIYGKRKVGKTTLIKKSLETSKDKTIYFECLKAPLQDNIDTFVSELVRNNVINSNISFKTFNDLFSFINQLPYTFNIIFDEYPYLKYFTPSETIDSMFQSIIDNNIKNIRLFISGSHVSMMKELLSENNALYGRFINIIHLKELDYLTSSLFYNNKTVYDKIAFYSVFGGSPYINQCIDNTLSLEENIINNILNPMSYVFGYMENLFISDYTNSINAERIFSIISNGHKKYKDIEEKLKLKTNGNLAKQLNILESMGIIEKVYPINKQDDKKKVYYEFKDNLLRFYYTYIYKNKSALQMLGAHSFYEAYIKDSINTFISHRFEDVVKSYFSLKAKNNQLKGLLNIGSFYYDDSITKTNGEFDVALKYKNHYEIYEVKYLTNEMSKKLIEKEVEQINNIQGLNIEKIGFVSVNGFESIDNKYIYLTGEDIYNI